ncbi:MAG TPA: PD-(D/E)XK nuclease family protein [Dehalococcoidia bacterium]
MPAPPDALVTIAQARRRDPLAPATVVAPSHVAAIQLRRRLAELGPFAGVRFETLPRIAELLGASDLARAGRSPLARPIGDYLAAQLAREARSDLADVRDLPGFARVLRQTFARLRRGGFGRAETLRSPLGSDLLAEVVRLYSEFRSRSERFYDDEDLFEAAAGAVAQRGSAAGEELGDVYVLPPGALSAGADALLRALRRAIGASRYHVLEDPVTSPETAFVLAPDPASETREVLREVLTALEAGAGLHEVAVFHGADRSYRALLAQAFEAAGIQSTPMPGTPLSETAGGRGVLALAELPLEHYSRTAVFDYLSLAPLRPFLPSHYGERVSAQPSAWLKLAREAGITRGIDRWYTGVGTLIADRSADLERDDLGDTRRPFVEAELREAQALDGVIRALVARLEPLRQRHAAAEFITAFRAIVDDYLDRDAPAMAAILTQIDQLGTIDAVGGAFTLDSFVAALRANLDAAYHRDGQLGEGVLVGDYRIAAGLSFQHAVLCGAYEGVFPAGAPQEALVEDRYWTELQRAGHPFLEDATLRFQRARADAIRAISVATQRLTWTAPLQAAGAGRDHYPSHLMLEAARSREPSIASATQLRRASPSAWLRKPPSPLAAMLTGSALDLTEARLRSAVLARRDGASLAAGHALQPALRLLGGRHGVAFSEYDGNLSALAGNDLIPRSGVSPTSLEHYAACGMRYFLNSVLRLRPPEEPEDRDTIDPRDRGTLVHDVLDRFFRNRLAQGRPAVDEPWRDADREELLDLLETSLEEARRRGRTGLDVYAGHERRRLRADLLTFLERDAEFRLETGARPAAFEYRIPETELEGITLRGVADRIDRTPDGRKAWVIDYKTGRSDYYKDIGSDADPVMGGTKLQLPVYLTAVADAEEARALYWFITSAGEFKRIEFANTPANLERYRETLSAILAGVRAGAFPAIPGEEDTRPGRSFQNCAFCDFTRVCSVRRDDELQTKSGDAALVPWAAVGRTARGKT